jgi:hypothetical protein
MKSKGTWGISAAAALAMIAGTVVAQQGQQGRPAGQDLPGQRVGQPQPGDPMQRQMQTGRTAQPTGAMRGMQPGEHHRAIGWMEGNWTANASRWDRPGGQAIEFQGDLRTEWVLDGRFLRFEFTSRDDEPARGFRGISFIGYNTVTDEYEGTWMDTTSTQLTHSEGHYHESSGVLTLHGKFADPSTGEEVKTRVVAHRESDGRWTWEMFNNPKGEGEFKSLEIVFTRGQGQPGQPGQQPGQPGIRPAQPGTAVPGGGLRPGETIPPR